MSERITCEIDVEENSLLQLQGTALETLAPGHWLITAQRIERRPSSVRDHSAFLNSYCAEDEGLYDDFDSTR